MINQEIQIDLDLLLETNDFDQLSIEFETMNEFDIAAFLNEQSLENSFALYRLLNQDIIIDVFTELDYEHQYNIISKLKDNEISYIIENLAIDNAVDMLEEMPDTMSEKLLSLASTETRKTLREYLKYAEDSVGSIMTAEYATLSKNMYISDALEYIRTHGENKETIYTCYIVDNAKKLIGVASIREILTADDNLTLEEIMRTQIVSVNIHSDKEDAAYLFGKYDFISLPVVDSHNRLVGVITIDDAADVILEETTKDIERMGGMAPSEKPYLKTSIPALARNRVFWLFVLMISGIFSEMVLEKYESIISVVPILVAFIPLLSDTCGDAGGQVTTLIIRGMALDEIRANDTLRIIGKEFLVSIFVGIPLAIINFARIYISNPADSTAGLVISLTLVFTLIFSNILGVILPMVAKKINIDPALMATPMIASIVDILSMVIYFFIASLLIL